MERESLDKESSISSKMSRREFLKFSITALSIAALKTTGFSVMEIDNQDENNFDEAAKSYIANTNKQAELVSQNIKMDKGASPSNICGPLATSILMGWKLNTDGTISNISNNKMRDTRLSGITPEVMWLGRPDDGSKRYEYAFPESEYNKYHIKQSIGTLDFDNIPNIKNLKPGDFLFLDGGSFTHYVAISRKDNQGRVFCVSNVHGEKKGEFVIKELMLWDPVKKDGFLRNWSKGVGPEKARTGTSGFYLWRRKEKAENLIDDDVAEKYRDILTNEMRKQKKGEWNVYVNEIGKGEIFSWKENIPYHAASTIKVPISILSLEVIKNKYRDEVFLNGLESVLNSKGVDGRTFYQLIHAMLVNSEENATESLAHFTSKHIDLKDGFLALGMHNTSYEPRRTTQKDLFKCWENIFSNEAIDFDTKEIALDMLQEYTENDDHFIGEMKKRYFYTKQWNKRGTIASDICTVQDCGIVEIPTLIGSRYLYIGIAGTSKTGKEISYEEASEFINYLVSKVADYVRDSSTIKNFKGRYIRI